MATVKRGAAKGGNHRRRGWKTGVALALLAAACGWWFVRASVIDNARVGTSFGARSGCSCRFVAGREMGSCKDDFPAGMGAVFISEDADEKSVTAYVPLIASQTARYHEGFGCVLENWND